MGQNKSNLLVKKRIPKDGQISVYCSKNVSGSPLPTEKVKMLSAWHSKTHSPSPATMMENTGSLGSLSVDATTSQLERLVNILSLSAFRKHNTKIL